VREGHGRRGGEGAQGALVGTDGADGERGQGVGDRSGRHRCNSRCNKNSGSRRPRSAFSLSLDKASRCAGQGMGPSLGGIGSDRAGLGVGKRPGHLASGTPCLPVVVFIKFRSARFSYHPLGSVLI
jgi:hypothetical protein